MRYYFAPMEGLTDSIFRQLHHKYFPGITRYYTPFFSPTVHRCLTPKEKRELPPADSLSFPVVPQILTKQPGDFLWMAQQCKDLGYGEVNLNLGCPSGTVTAKGKGSGMLKDLQALDSFLYEIFAAAPLPVSVKTRLGYDTPDEFPRILEVLNRYPIQELTVHPRVRSAFYKGDVDMEMFRHAINCSQAPVCYNGNLCTMTQIQTLGEEFPTVQAVMIGRSLIADPGMVTPGGSTREALSGFYGELMEAYIQAFGCSRNAMFRMKENWRYLACRFAGSEKLYKQLRKTTDLTQYQAITREIFDTLPLKEELTVDW